MEAKKEELRKLKVRLEEIEPLITKSFKTSEQLKAYLEDNKELYKEGRELFEQIQQLEWELMSPEERAEEELHLKLMQLKRQGKL